MINKVILIGNVGADPEVRVLEGGTKVARVRIATTEKIYNRTTQERRDHTEWHTITLWGGLAEVADRYVKKGSQIYIEGKLRSRQWEDEATKTKRYSVEILADDLKLLGRKDAQADGGGYGAGPGYAGASNQSSPKPYVPQQPYSQGNMSDIPQVDDVDDLPF
ncbi:MAG: single-stranded DNA-binding protein [Rikenellaceae bacterium]|nr:single-stranded DNA-binding protein [Rikenellaceae bacterium]